MSQVLSLSTVSFVLFSIVCLGESHILAGLASFISKQHCIVNESSVMSVASNIKVDSIRSNAYVEWISLIDARLALLAPSVVKQQNQ